MPCRRNYMELPNVKERIKEFTDNKKIELILSYPLHGIFNSVTWSPTNRRKKEESRSIPQVINPGQSDSQQMFAFCDRVKEIVVPKNRLTGEGRR